jgi:CRP-like cAMP-binding protein
MPEVDVVSSTLPDPPRRLATLVEELGDLLGNTDVPVPDQVVTLRAVADALEETGAPIRCKIIPFFPGRRPTDEIAHPGLGSSDGVMVRLGSDERGNVASILYDVGQFPASAMLEARVTLESVRPGEASSPIQSWSGRQLEPDISARRQRIDISPETALDGLDLGFESGLLRRARVEIRVEHLGQPLAGDETHLDVCDIGELGRLYERVVDRILVPDTARQAAAADAPDPGVAYHPWFPVLNIGGDKAALYSKALVADIVDKSHHLSDPAWLLRVGIYLELLTCIGIAEAVRDDFGDVLDPGERAAYETSPVYSEIRERVDPQAWSEVWSLRAIAFPKLGIPRTGTVSAANLLAKRRATLAFLHAHHEDLKHAIALAGPNHHNSQETWHRVFRDAERAVLRQTTSSFPELAFLPASMREFVLWQRRGIADQQGLYATACVQYRASMNDVAAWARTEGLMDYTGAECVPKSASLLEAHVHDPARVAGLQQGDGYGPTLELTPLIAEATPTTEEIDAMVASVPIFSVLGPTDAAALARTARPVLLAPHERLVRHGDSGTSLFIVADGEVEVMLRTESGEDVYIEPMGSGEIVGEMSFLTGEPRSATVRAGLDGSLVFEITREAFAELARSHPEWLDHLTSLMDERLRRRREILLDRASRRSLRTRIRGWVFDGS